MAKTEIKNGKLYGSKASAHQHIVQDREPKRWNALGDPVEWTKPLVAEFAQHGGTFTFHNHLTGATDTAADIRGHYFDSAAQAMEKGWTQEEHDIVVEALDLLCQRYGGVWEIQHAKAALPWPTYDDTHHSQIAKFAAGVGLVSEALAYERENKNRPGVVKELEAAQAAPAAEEAGEIVAA